jgi:NTP pyrophosphatase (non-canonical NTP hydrolase)
MKDSLNHLIEELRLFAKERDWEQFHSPKNISMALVVEASEILEIFQWLTSEESLHLNGNRLAKAKDEIGDVLIYLVRLADRLSISPVEAAHEKLRKNRKKYPIKKSRGNAKKYTEFKK